MRQQRFCLKFYIKNAIIYSISLHLYVCSKILCRKDDKNMVKTPKLVPTLKAGGYELLMHNRPSDLPIELFEKMIMVTTTIS